MTTAPAPDTDAAILALREQGAQRLEPLRLAFIEVLARRACAHHGETRRLLDARLATLLADCKTRLSQARPAPARDPATRPGPLAELTARLAQRPGESGAPTELNALRRFRPTWARLSADLRLAQSSAKAPENAGPLNSQALALRSLKLMRDVSPAYLNHFMAYLDTLMWLEQVQGGPWPTARDNARSDTELPRKTPRKKARGG